MKEDNLEPNVSTYNAILRSLASRNQIAALDVMTLMTNRGIKPDEVTIDSFLLGYLNSKRPESGISMVQSCFNQYGCRPSKESYFKVLSMLLEDGQGFEASRTASIFRQLWPSDEEALLEAVKVYGMRSI